MAVGGGGSAGPLPRTRPMRWPGPPPRSTRSSTGTWAEARDTRESWRRGIEGRCASGGGALRGFPRPDRGVAFEQSLGAHHDRYVDHLAVHREGGAPGGLGLGVLLDDSFRVRHVLGRG